MLAAKPWAFFLFLSVLATQASGKLIYPFQASDPYLINNPKNTYFSANFAQAQDKFRAAARASQSRFKPIMDIPTGLFTNLLSNEQHLPVQHIHIPPKSGKFEKLLIVVSGVHGIEGYYGSGIQISLLDDYVKGRTLIPDDMGVLMIHMVNPYGSKFGRRFNLWDVDLNRNGQDNFDLDDINPLYDIVHELLVKPIQSTVINAQAIGAFRAQRDALKNHIEIIKSGKSYRDIEVGGQYRFADGLYYGGNRKMDSTLLLKRIVKNYIQFYEKGQIIDLHSGLGMGPQLLIIARKGDAEIFKRFTADF